MGLLDNAPELKKNSFTVDEASDLFKKIAEEMKKDDTPAQVVDALIKFAELAVKILFVRQA